MPATRKTKRAAKRKTAPKDRRKNKGKARRVTIFRDGDQKFRYRVQGHNWKVIEAAEEGFARKGTVTGRIAKKYPGVEVVDLTA